MTYVEAVGAVQQRSFDAIKAAQSTQVATLRATSDLTQALLALPISLFPMPAIVRAMSKLTAFSFALLEQQVAYSKQLADVFASSVSAVAPAAIAPNAPPLALAAPTSPLALAATAPPLALAAMAPPLALAATARPLALAATAPPDALAAPAPPDALLAAAAPIALAAPIAVPPLAPHEPFMALEAVPPVLETQPPSPASAGEATVRPALSEDVVTARSIELAAEPLDNDEALLHIAQSASQTSDSPPPVLVAEPGAKRTVETIGSAASPPLRETLTEEMPSRTFPPGTVTPPTPIDATSIESAPPNPAKIPSVSNSRSKQRRNPRRK